MSIDSQVEFDVAVDPVYTDWAGFLIAQLGRAVTRRYRTAMAPIGLNPRETTVLLQLHGGGTVGQQALGAVLDIDPSNLVVLLNDLELEGLISRRRDPEDRRRHVVEITRKGAALVERVLGAAADVEDELFAPLDDDERRVLRDLLARVIKSTDVPSAREVGEDC